MNPVHILIAEDDEDDYDLFVMAISELALDVIIDRAEHGEFVLQLIDEKNPHIVFLDIRMPCKDGQACLKEIRSNKKYDQLAVIILSSTHTQESIEFCKQEGANLYVIKPESFSGLKLILKKILSKNWKESLHFPDLGGFVIN